jgi:hypothetical protein
VGGVVIRHDEQNVRAGVVLFCVMVREGEAWKEGEESEEFE